MKKWLIFGEGVITGVILTMVVLGIAAYSIDDERMKRFEKPGEIIEVRSLKVFQVLEDNSALVNGLSDEHFQDYNGPIFLLKNEEGKYYYDDEIIDIPKGKVVRQVGVFHYQTKGEIDKTVAVIQIMNE